MTLDELFEKYHAAWLVVARQPAGDRQTAGRAGIRAVVAGLRDEIVQEFRLSGKFHADNLYQLFNEILASDGVEAASSATAQTEGDVHELRTSIGSPEGREAGGPRGMEREGNVSLSGERLAVHGQPSAASGNLPRGDSDRLPPSHRHEDSGRPVRAVGGFTVGPDCRGLERGHGVSRGEAAGGSTREDEKAVEAAGAKGPVTVNSPAAAPVCEWTKSPLRLYEHSASILYRTGCGADFFYNYKQCQGCGKPIKFTEAAR